jgi:2-keto-4-pentenoate hydratase
MAKQRPSLGVSAAPVSTYVASVAPAVELYDQQSVNLALQFADAFKDLSVSAAQIAGSMKKQMNEEDVQKGIDLVNQSRKSYKTLVDSGEIKPTENPWMAIGAQQASGTMEGMKARAHFGDRKSVV